MQICPELIGHRVGYRDFFGVDHFGFIADLKPHRTEEGIAYLAIVHEEGDLPNDKPYTLPNGQNIMIGEYLRSDLCVPADPPPRFGLVKEGKS